MGMKQSLCLKNLKPQSVNSMYFGTGSGYSKTSKARDWTMEVFFQLSMSDNEKALKIMREAFDAEKHAYKVNLTALYPPDIYFTKKGTISAKCQDLSNWEKPIIDCIFLSKFFDLPVPQGCQNLNIDDKYVVELNSRKLPSDRYEILVDLEIIELAAILCP